jgi:hypothetical protein
MKKKFNFEDLWNQDSRPLIMDYQSPGQRSRSPPTHYFNSSQSSARGLYDSKSKLYHTQIERIIGPLKDTSKPQNKFTSSVQDLTDFNETYLSMSPERTLLNPSGFNSFLPNGSKTWGQGNKFRDNFPGNNENTILASNDKFNP